VSGGVGTVRSTTLAFGRHIHIVNVLGRRLGRVAMIAMLVASFVAVPAASYAHWAPSNYETFVEQVASQKTLTALVDNEIGSMRLGKSRIRRGVCTTPVTVYFRDGRVVSGTLVLKQYKWRWYFYSITAGGAGGISGAVLPPDISPSIMGTAYAQQRKNQTFASAVVYNRYPVLTVQSVAKNWGTATIRMRMSGGKRKPRTASIVCISKDSSNGKTYWFLASVR
jgi:hypothetical protein